MIEDPDGANEAERTMWWELPSLQAMGECWGLAGRQNI